jgi:hypothetical protein
MQVARRRSDDPRGGPNTPNQNMAQRSRDMAGQSWSLGLFMLPDRDSAMRQLGYVAGENPKSPILS